MRALIFAAGRGERMRPLTDRIPKPLLEVRGKPLIVHHLERLADSGIRDVVINTSHLADQFPKRLGDGARWDLHIHYAYEGGTALETGGGMLHALALLGGEPFLAINGDIYTDFALGDLPQRPGGLAHLVLVDNPPHHPQGDFTLGSDGTVLADTAPRLTFAGIGLYKPAILVGWRNVIGATPGANDDPPRFKLAPILMAAIHKAAVTGQRHAGIWTDVGTPERLAALNA